MNSAEIVSAAYKAFENFGRPHHFTDYRHCEECAEHDETMRSCSLHEIGPNEVGNVGWSPIPLLTDEAYGYVMPRLLELAITGGRNAHDEPFIFQYLLALSPPETSTRFNRFTSEQASVLLESLEYIKKHMSEVVENQCCEEDLNLALNVWKANAPNQ